MSGFCSHSFQGRLGQLRETICVSRIVVPHLPRAQGLQELSLPMHMRSGAAGSPASSSFSSSSSATAAAASRFRSHFLQLFPSGSTRNDF